MNKIKQDELLDLAAYEGIRNQFRARIIELKKHRRIALGPNLTLVFENRDTMLFQVQEMLRTERITQTHAIQHELDTYNELIPDPDHLSATLFVEVEDKHERSKLLSELSNLRGHIQLRAGTHVAVAEFHVNDGEEEGRLPAVNYLSFQLTEDAQGALADNTQAASLEATHPAYQAETPLSSEVRKELLHDLGD